MNDIAPIGRPNMLGLDRPAAGAKLAGSGPAASRGQDAAEFTPMAKLLSKLQDLPEVRSELIEKVQARLESGHYDDPKVLDDALDNLLREEGLLD